MAMLCIYGGICTGCNECALSMNAEPETKDMVIIIDFEG